MKPLRTDCCIAGGGPAGMMLGLLLARAGVNVIVLEKHEDFLRDFRGDTIHPSTLEVIHELGLADGFLRRPHQKVESLSAQIGTVKLRLARFDRLPTRSKFLVFMPQWEFLDFVAEAARRYENFRLLMSAEVKDVIEEEDGGIRGVMVEGPDGPLEIRADLVVGADGRNSVIRDKAKLEIEELGAPMDVLWFPLARTDSDDPETVGHVEPGRIMFMINRGTYWQCAYVIPKGSLEALKSKGIANFRAEVLALSPFLGLRVNELRSWDDIKLLAVRIDRLKRWYKPGLLCIGDAAHAMSPVGGVGINLAVQDAVAAANLLAEPLLKGTVTVGELEAVQARRDFPARLTQWVQLLVQQRMIRSVLNSNRTFRPPWPLRLLPAIPILRMLPGLLIGVGIRPEHVRIKPGEMAGGGRPATG